MQTASYEAPEGQESLPRCALFLDQAYWLLAFALAFFTMNIPLISGLGGEYQPLLFGLLALVAVARVPVFDKGLLVHSLLLACSLLLMALWHALNQTLDQVSLLRCVIGIVFLLCAGPLLLKLPAKGLVVLLWLHIAFAALGLVLPGVAKAIVSVLGLRGTVYYDGWNAFTANEPSYAAINISALSALLLIKDSREPSAPRRTVTLLGVALALVCTKSVTGLALALLHLLPLTYGWLRRLFAHWALLSGGLLLLLGVLLLVGSTSMGVGDEVSRVGSAVVTAMEVIRAGSLLPFFLVEPSGAWRLLTNFGGIMTALQFPLGTGGLSLHSVIFSVLPTQYAEFVETSSVYVILDGEFSAQTPLANIAVFGGILPTITLLLLGGTATKRALQAAAIEARIIIAGYVLVGLLWQGTLTAPGWWLVVGAVMTLQVQPKAALTPATVDSP